MTPGGCIRRIAAVFRTVPDLDRAMDFYRSALGFEVEQPPHELGPREIELMGAAGATVTAALMTLGTQSIGLLAFDPPGRPYPADSTASDLWFQHCAVVVADMEDVFERVSRHSFLPLTVGGPQQLPANTGGVRAFKFRDPFGHPLELLWFPPGVGDPAWRQSRAKPIEGIDHTAIAVGDADIGARFYRDVLGFSTGDRSRNQGAAQDRLDAIRHDDVDVVALMPKHAPPHLELLGYRAGTRRRPHDSAPADASLSRTLAEVDDLAPLIAAVERYPSSRGGMSHGRWGGRDAVGFPDPDGHIWICVAS